MAVFPHTTLEYRDGFNHEGGYGKEAPDGAWEFDAIQVWGLPKEIREVPLGHFAHGAHLKHAWGDFLP
jgi:hypothetical protein